MRPFSRLGRTFLLLVVFGFASHFAIEYGTGGLWKGLRSAHAVVGGEAEVPYDLTQLRAVNATLDHIRKKYVEPERVDPRQMFLGALDMIQKRVAQVIVSHEKGASNVTVRVEDEEQQFRVDNVQGHWDVAARLREVFAFMQKKLRDTEVELPEIEYAAANGMLRTLDPHSVFLSPEEYKEMNVSTSGHFGGLGIVISIRDQALTVMRPMPDTPAGRAGLARLDRITKINNESTLNMPLSDAVDRLRGEPGSKVTVWVHRDGKNGWNGSRPFELVREVIRVSSVDHEALDGKVGYVRIKQFQQTTSRELHEALRELKKKESLQGLVLDLRDDPGGLLDQAGRVADTFIEQGTIFATVGASEGRHEQSATRAGTEPDYPIIVLVNEGSASASEIVAGALKNQNRAVVLGRTTFGKGSVQLVFPEITEENAALKLTIAQYLTPGDISIQGTGVTPDIELDPMTADLQEMDLYVNEDNVRERDLSKTLNAGGRRIQEPPAYQLRYNLPESVRAEIRERGSTLDDVFEEDTPIRIARTLVSKMKSGPRQKQLEQLSGVVEEIQAREIDAVSEDLKKLGIDWTAPPKTYEGGPSPKDVTTKLWTSKKGDVVTAGEAMELTVEVTNNGKSPLYQLHAITQSDSGYYDQKELVFGKVEPGESKQTTVPLGWCKTEGREAGSTKPVPLDAKRICTIPKDAVHRQDAVQVRFFAAGADVPEALSFKPTIESLPQPIFAYSTQVVDNRSANENGQLEKGEGATIYFHIKNVGQGPAYETQANLRNLTGDGVLLKAGRFDVSGMKPGEERNVAFTFDVLPTLKADELSLEVSVIDQDLGAYSSEKLALPLFGKKAARSIKPASFVRVSKGKAVVRSEPEAAAPVVGYLEDGAAVKAKGMVGQFVQVALSDDRFGFVSVEELSEGAAKTADKVARFVPELSHSAPRLAVEAKALATRGDVMSIDVVATDDNGGVQDAFVFVGDRKVFYMPNKEKGGKRMKFSLDAPLKSGVNVITVVARENRDVVSRHRIVVRKDGKNGEILPTPKNDMFGEDWEFGEP
jgi:carboxyl-terminal processing protease